MKKKIFLIDDDEDLLRSFQVILESKGFDVLTSSDGTDCFLILKNHSPDLLVLDVMMKTDFEGYYLLQEIKKDPQYRKMPVILLTGMKDHIGVDFFSSVEDKSLFPNVRYQDKPIYSHLLVEMIEEMLEELQNH